MVRKPQSIKDSERVARLAALLTENPRHKLLREGVDAHLAFWELGGRDPAAMPAAVELGRLGGKKTGRKGLAAMPAEQRRAIQEKAWAVRRKSKSDHAV